ARSLDDVHVLYIDGDFDDAPPDPATCQSGAAMAVWLLTHQSPFWPGPELQPSQVTVLGWSKPSRLSEGRVNSIPLTDLRRVGAANAAREVLDSIPSTANILVHFDIDVMADAEFPAAYFPHDEGLSREQMGDVLGLVLQDPRIRILEISEYSALRDFGRER